jgi:DNA modification methylase
MEEGRLAWEEAHAEPLTRTETVSGVDGSTRHSPADGPANRMIFADNLSAMKSCADQGMAGAFHLIYADPPFFSKNNYEGGTKLKLPAGETQLSRQTAYRDSWQDGMEGYLRMLVPRFYAFRELLADTGSFWIHLDWHAVHYVKVVLDAIFGGENFINEVIWNYKSGGVSRRRFARKHDSLLFYGKTSRYYFAPQQEKSYNRGLKPYRFKGVKEYRDETGWYTWVNRKDVWQIDMVGRTSGERTGYATQKPEALLARILESCTKEGDLCADFFGGSGTLAAVAQRMGRRWLFCDAGQLAQVSAQKRMLSAGADFEVLAGAGTKLCAEGTFEAACRAEPSPDPGKTVFRVELTRYAFPAGLPDAEEKQADLIKSALREDSMQFVAYWSVDFRYDGICFRPQASLCREKDTLESACARLLAVAGPVAVRVADIFGNRSMRLLEVERRA